MGMPRPDGPSRRSELAPLLYWGPPVTMVAVMVGCTVLILASMAVDLDTARRLLILAEWLAVIGVLAAVATVTVTGRVYGWAPPARPTPGRARAPRKERADHELSRPGWSFDQRV